LANGMTRKKRRVSKQIRSIACPVQTHEMAVVQRELISLSSIVFVVLIGFQ
jgi:hypothetical protein